MTRVRRFAAAAFTAAALGTLVSPAIAAAQPGNCCCPPGQTGVIYGCSSFCIPGKVLDSQTGLCVAAAPPAPSHP
ncbi:hypothetical protein [Mycobacterium deserti]|uniref:Uncharacterized protein n=1 Tax=Mycobacterium deserti TaxID=2978347 RepID=A0ABT2MGJ0_9MYCO|nr:hypothetical protein [Mycobacterium deserti]MCT7661409.1 hypothetical protein [Mycobacterium deserti]